MSDVDYERPDIILGARTHVLCPHCGAEPGQNCRVLRAGVTVVMMPDNFAHMFRRMDFYHKFNPPSDYIDDLIC